jgi:hypothetical protein
MIPNLVSVFERRNDLGHYGDMVILKMGVADILSEYFTK